jgi:hypothetical protein
MKVPATVRLIVVIGAALLGWVLPVTATQATKRDAILQWRGHTASVTVEIVRGDVQVIREPRVDIALEGFSSGAPISLEMMRISNGWLLRDVYPDSPARQVRLECLPPAGAHGDFYSRLGRVEVTVRAPPATEIEVRVLERI